VATIRLATILMNLNFVDCCSSFTYCLSVGRTRLHIASKSCFIPWIVHHIIIYEWAKWFEYFFVLLNKPYDPCSYCLSYCVCVIASELSPCAFFSADFRGKLKTYFHYPECNWGEFFLRCKRGCIGPLLSTLCLEWPVNVSLSLKFI